MRTPLLMTKVLITYIGTGNGQPWNQHIRSPGDGDNLFICSIVAVDADTGEYVWHCRIHPVKAGTTTP